jgi:hypothetical protein
MLGEKPLAVIKTLLSRTKFNRERSTDPRDISKGLCMPPLKKRPSIYDVAKMASVSPATVSKVLHGVTTVKKANVERINNAIEVLGYRHDPMASDMRREKRRIIAMSFLGSPPKRWSSNVSRGIKPVI